jgi:hypothetical protein
MLGSRNRVLEAYHIAGFLVHTSFFLPQLQYDYINFPYALFLCPGPNPRKLVISHQMSYGRKT